MFTYNKKHEFQNQRKEASTEARKLLDSVSPEQWGDEHDAKYNELTLKISNLDAAIDREEVLLQEYVEKKPPTNFAAEGQIVDKHGRVVRAAVGSQSIETEGEKQSREGFHIGHVLRAMASGEYRREAPEVVRNVLETGTGASGGFAVPTSWMPSLIDTARRQSVVTAAGATTVQMESGAVNIPLVVSDPTASWRAENELVGEGQPSFDNVQLVAKSLAVKCIVSDELLQDGIQIEEAIRRALGRAIALEFDRAALMGAGTEIEPQGLIGIIPEHTAAAVNSVTWEDIGGCNLKIRKTENQANAIISSIDGGYSLDMSKDNNGRYLEPPRTLSTLQRLDTTALNDPAAGKVSAIVGDFSKLILGVRSRISIELLRGNYRDRLQYAFLVHMRADVAVTERGAFAALKHPTAK